MDMHMPSDEEFDQLPHVILTSDIDWDLAIVDCELDLEEWLDARMEANDLPGINEYGDLPFDNQGFYRSVQVTKSTFFDAYQVLPIVDSTAEDIVDKLESKYRVNPHQVTTKDPEFEKLRPSFAWVPVDIITVSYTHLTLPTILRV